MASWSTPRRTAVIALLLAVALAACTHDESKSSAAPSSPITDAAASTPTTPTTPTASATPAGPAGEPLDVITWWAAHPSYTPVGIADDTLIFNKRIVGSQIIVLPKVSSYANLVVALTCSPPSEYAVLWGTQDNPAWTWTKGESCGAPLVNSYKTPPLNRKDLPIRLYVLVPAGTTANVALFGVPKTSKIK